MEAQQVPTTCLVRWPGSGKVGCEPTKAHALDTRCLLKSSFHTRHLPASRVLTPDPKTPFSL